MARIRTIKPEFFDDPDLALTPPHARLLFIGLWQQADKAGRLVEDTRRLRARVFPYEPDIDVGDLLAHLARGRFVVRYQVDGVAYLAVRNFGKHQQPHVREPESTIPAPGQHCTRTGPALDQPEAGPGPAPAEHPPAPETKGRGKVKEGKGTVHEHAASADAFETFWHSYPRHVGKAEAQKAWKALKPSAQFLDLVLAAVERQARSRQWRADGGKFIPYPATWLRRQGWDDELDGEVRAPPGYRRDEDEWVCPHAPHCGARGTCERRQALDDAKQGAVA